MGNKDNRSYQMLGASGYTNIDVRTILGDLSRVNYITFVNMTPDQVKLYPQSTDPNILATSAANLQIGLFSAITLPFTNEWREGFILAWSCTIPTFYAIPQNFTVILSEDNLGINLSQAPGFYSVIPGSAVDIVGNTVGLANAFQLPVALTGSGNLKVALLESVELNDYTVNPLTNTASNAATLITQAGVPGKSWYISYMNWRVSGTAAVGASNLAVTLKDNAATVYASAIPSASPNGTNLSITFPQPIKITAGNAFSFNIASPANAGCVIYANVGAFNK